MMGVRRGVTMDMRKTRASQRRVKDMSTTSSPDSGKQLPDWALGQAMNDLDDDDTAGRDERAQELVQAFEDERHDADDDADEGGEG